MKDCKCHYCTGGTYDPNYVDPLDETCKKCGHELYRADCWNGCDDGYFDGYDEDPLWYDQGDLIRCDVCRGHGCLIFCPGCELKEKESVIPPVTPVTFSETGQPTTPEETENHGKPNKDGQFGRITTCQDLSGKGSVLTTDQKVECSSHSGCATSTSSEKLYATGYTSSLREIKRLCAQFKAGLLGSRESDNMCFMVCAPLAAYLGILGIKTRLVEGYFYKWHHWWLELETGTVIDPTCDQFSGRNIKFPNVYVGPAIHHKKI